MSDIKNEAPEEETQEAAPKEDIPMGEITLKTQPHGKIYDNILETIGATPMVRLPGLKAKYELNADIIAKLESRNPYASTKDRAVLAMIQEAENAGKITPGETTIIEASAGNSGMSLAAICAAKNYELILAMPENTQIDRRKVIEFYGTKIFLTPSDRGMMGANEKVEELLKEKGENGYRINIFENPAGPQIHFQTTAKEIWEDTSGNIDILVAGIGSGATISGIGKALKKAKPDLKIIGIEPAESPALSDPETLPTQHSISGIGVGFKPKILNEKLIDEVKTISSARAYEVAKEAAQTDGIPAGISSGAALAVAIEIAQSPEGRGKTIAVILPSFAERYLSTPLFEVPETKI